MQESMREKTVRSWSGILIFFVMLIGIVGCLLWLLVWVGVSSHAAGNGPSGLMLFPVILLGILLFMYGGFYKIEPNQAAVLTFFGRYVGTVRDNGLRWNFPLFSKHKVSMRIRNFESSKLKVNELDGSPIEIAAVFVWQVVDASEAVFNVDDYESFVHIQSEAALRAMATSYPYDQHEENQLSLRSHAKEVSEHLKEALSERLHNAGIAIIDARISHLAYAPEIAQAMLQRQQASAIIAARTQIVAGAVGMVKMALQDLENEGIVSLDDERKAAMVSNLLVVLCGEKGTQPVVNAGSLY